MIKFQSLIKKFDRQGEKTGWSYIEISAELAETLNPGIKKSFRVKGLLDQVPISGLSLLPMGGGNFILSINAELRRLLKKKAGQTLAVALTLDHQAYVIDPELLVALEVDPKALQYFKTLPISHQNYFSKWVDAAKTKETKYKRIEACFLAMLKKQNYAEMIRSQKHNTNVR